jgi:hypothetical protein
VPIERIDKRQRAELRQAARAGRARDQQRALEWLLAFAETPIGTDSGVADRIRLDLITFQQVPLSGLLRKDCNATRAQIRHLTVHDLATVQQQIANLVETVWPRDPTRTDRGSIPLAPPDLEGLFWTRVGKHGVLARTVVSARWPASFWWAVILLVEQHSGRIRRCQARQGSTRCAQLFVRTRRQTFCSKACARRELARRWYEAHRAEAQRRRRATYAQQKAARTIP